MSGLEGELRRIVSEIGGVPGDFDGQAHFYRELGMGSFKSIDLLMALEERYGISIPDDRFLDATSLVRLSAMMEALLQR